MITQTSAPSSSRVPSPWLVGVTLPIAIVLFAWVQGYYNQMTNKEEIVAQREAAKLEVAAQRDADQRRHYLGMAVGILGEKGNPKTPLKNWAVDVLAPVLLAEETLAALRSGEAVLAYKPLESGHYQAYTSTSDTPTFTSDHDSYVPSYVPRSTKDPSGE